MPSWSLTQLDRTENTKVSSSVMVGHYQVMVGLPTIAEAMDTITIACHKVIPQVSIMSGPVAMIQVVLNS